MILETIAVLITDAKIASVEHSTVSTIGAEFSMPTPHATVGNPLDELHSEFLPTLHL